MAFPIAAALGAAGSIIGGKMMGDSAEDAAEAARELPDWLKPYVTGGGVPEYLQSQPKTNTAWMDYISRLGSGQPAGPWQPMNNASPWFNPDQTFTPQQDGSPYGALPEGMAPHGQIPPQQQQGGGGMDMDALTSFLKNKQSAMMLGGEGAQYGNTGNIYGHMRRMNPDMSYQEMDKMNELAKLLGR